MNKCTTLKPHRSVSPRHGRCPRCRPVCRGGRARCPPPPRSRSGCRAPAPGPAAGPRASRRRIACTPRTRTPLPPAQLCYYFRYSAVDRDSYTVWSGCRRRPCSASSCPRTGRTPRWWRSWGPPCPLSAGSQPRPAHTTGQVLLFCMSSKDPKKPFTKT